HASRARLQGTPPRARIHASRASLQGTPPGHASTPPGHASRARLHASRQASGHASRARLQGKPPGAHASRHASRASLQGKPSMARLQGTAPGHASRARLQASTPPGHASTPPGHTSRASLQGTPSTPPGHASRARLQASTPPGHASTPPGKTIRINIIDDEEYEKNKSFFLQMGEPQLLEMSERKAVLLQEVGGFVKTGKDVYRKVQGPRSPCSDAVLRAVVPALAVPSVAVPVPVLPEAVVPGGFVFGPMMAALGTKFVEAGITKLGHLKRTSVETLCHTINIKSSRVIQRVVEDIMQSLSAPERAFIEDPARLDTWKEENDYEFPSLTDGAEQLLTKREEEERRVAEMGRPTLGEHAKLEVVIEESYEFKNTVDKILKKTNLALVIGTNSWREQFVDAITVNSGDDDEDGCGEEKLPSCFDYVMHFLTVFWKILFALVPPTDYLNGWACFVVSISGIGLLTAVIGDLASHFGCTVGLKDSVTAVVFVALGTSVPDTFASKVSAIQDQYADASIGNVTGSNAVNVFLGIGVAWSIAAIYHAIHGEEFRVDPGTLAFSVTLFCIFAFICIGVLLYRRRPSIGGELGGPRVPKILTSCLFFSLWLLYIVFSSLEAYCHVQGF
ncbi:hypothetical protein KUCAC02_033453, partial [Chaenocephalus aceratus]